MEEINYPLLYPCTLEKWKVLENAANLLLGFPNHEKETYSQKIKDASGNIYFIVNEETSSLLDLGKCLKFEDVEFPKFK
jgi:hypothetical protein